MNSKKIKIIVSILAIVAVFAIIGFCLYLKYKNNDIKSNDIPNDYIAIFNGDSGELFYATYIYKIDNGRDNHGFKYINTTSTTASWGSKDWKTNITDKGEVTSIDDVLAVAKKNNAYSYVTLPNDDKIYSIDEFRTMFLAD